MYRRRFCIRGARIQIRARETEKVRRLTWTLILVIGMACLLALGGCDDIFEDLEEDIHEDDEYGYYYDEEEDEDSAIISQHSCGTVWSGHPNDLQVSPFCTQACQLINGSQPTQDIVDVCRIGAKFGPDGRGNEFADNCQICGSYL